jgi:hypothetical protein
LVLSHNKNAPSYKLKRHAQACRFHGSMAEFF